MLNLAPVSAWATMHAVRVCIEGSAVNSRDRPCSHAEGHTSGWL